MLQTLASSALQCRQFRVSARGEEITWQVVISTVRTVVVLLAVRSKTVQLLSLHIAVHG